MKKQTLYEKKKDEASKSRKFWTEISLNTCKKILKWEELICRNNYVKRRTSITGWGTDLDLINSNNPKAQLLRPLILWTVLFKRKCYPFEALRAKRTPSMGTTSAFVFNLIK